MRIGLLSIRRRIPLEAEYVSLRGKNNKMPKKDEFEPFDRLMQKVIKVPHSEIKAKLDAEKKAKKQKKSAKVKQNDTSN
jgi:hypothetical protein